MVRTSIQLTDTQVEQLEQIAQRERLSVSELVCRAVDVFLVQQARRRAAAAVGVFSSGDRDVSVRHDEYLAKADRE